MKSVKFQTALRKHLLVHCLYFVDQIFVWWSRTMCMKCLYHLYCNGEQRCLIVWRPAKPWCIGWRYTRYFLTRKRQKYLDRSIQCSHVCGVHQSDDYERRRVNRIYLRYGIMWSECGSASVGYCVRDQCPCCEHQ